jgi:hypothetical protein
MQLPANIKDAEPWGSDDQVPPGVYNARVSACDEQMSRNGNPMLVITWRVDAGEWKGAELRDHVTVVEATAGRVVSLLMALGIAIPESGMLAPSTLVGKRATIVVRNDPFRGDDGEMRDSSKVKGYRAADNGSDVPSDGFLPVGSTAVVSDDDIPF